MSETHVIILAGGKGTRMNMDAPKVLVELEGKPLLHHLLENIKPITQQPTLVVGYKQNEVRSATDHTYHYVHQTEQLGTGHAVLCARNDLKNKQFRNIIVLPGDCPLVSEKTLRELVTMREQHAATITMASITAPHFDEPFTDLLPYGRIIRDTDGRVQAIVEYKDATEEQRNIKELNTGFYCFDATWLWEHLDALQNNNNSQEYYITDLVELAVTTGKRVQLATVSNPYEGIGVNTQEQLQKVIEYLRTQ